MKKTERKIKIKFEKLVKNEDVMYDNYFKIVYSSKVVLNNQNINLLKNIKLFFKTML